MGGSFQVRDWPRSWFYIYHRLHAVRFALATVVDVGAKTDYDAWASGHEA